MSDEQLTTEQALELLRQHHTDGDDFGTDAALTIKRAQNQMIWLRDALSKSAPIVAQGYWHADQMDREDAEQFIDAAEAIHAAGMWPDESGPL